MGYYLLTVCNNCFCQVRLPKLVSDGMILQRNTKVKIWGWASAGEKLNIDFNDHKYYAVTTPEGEWQVVLDPIKAGGPYTMEINASNHNTIHNILAGDVWLCSGQSNMVLSMKRVEAGMLTLLHIRKIRPSGNLLSRQVCFYKPAEDLSSGHWEWLIR
jgi:sialate O-acetylesterase